MFNIIAFWFFSWAAIALDSCFPDNREDAISYLFLLSFCEEKNFFFPSWESILCVQN